MVWAHYSITPFREGYVKNDDREDEFNQVGPLQGLPGMRLKR